MMNPAFAYSNIKEMVPIFIHVSSILKGLIENEINQGNSNINLTPYISKAALDIIGLVAYNSILNSSPSTLQIAITILSEYVPFIGDIPIGHDTTNVATCWALYLLVQHPHEQDLLREELVKA
ncbi:uncharacterized protein OCT59_023777 [Rhizophagus irregularis]|uniref:uncharacterized protein n=1 Tax=Rhizophagus irregularis TaxID=588596 RepID=UPI003317BCAB|nr:hypothetical protein OCT59_023777 [Rhizophagus irregularis]